MSLSLTSFLERNRANDVFAPPSTVDDESSLRFLEDRVLTYHETIACYCKMVQLSQVTQRCFSDCQIKSDGIFQFHTIQNFAVDSRNKKPRTWLIVDVKTLERLSPEKAVDLLKKCYQNYRTAYASLPFPRLTNEKEYLENGGLCFEYSHPLPEILDDITRFQIRRIFNVCQERRLFFPLHRLNFGLKGSTVVITYPYCKPEDSWERKLPSWKAQFPDINF